MLSNLNCMCRKNSKFYVKIFKYLFLFYEYHFYSQNEKKETLNIEIWVVYTKLKFEDFWTRFGLVI